MPEIERVADLAEEAERRGGEEACRPARRGTAVEQRDGARGGEEGGEPWIRHLSGERHPRNSDRSKAGPREGTRTSRGTHHANEGEQATGTELPDARRQQVEGACWRGVGEPHAECKGGDDANEERRNQAPRTAATPGEQHDERWPDEVELFFDTERPEVQEGRRTRSCGEVVHRTDEAHVGDGECRRCAICRQLASIKRRSNQEPNE